MYNLVLSKVGGTLVFAPVVRGTGKGVHHRCPFERSATSACLFLLIIQVSGKHRSCNDIINSLFETICKLFFLKLEHV